MTPNTPTASSAEQKTSLHEAGPSGTPSGDEAATAKPTYTLNIDEGVVEKIASKAAQKIDGIIDMRGNLLSRVQEGLGGSDQKKGVSADVTDETSARVELDIILEYGKSATKVFDQIKESVGKDLKDMTGLNVAELTVNVVDVMTQDEYDEKNGGEKSSDNSDGGQNGGSQR